MELVNSYACYTEEYNAYLKFVEQLVKTDFANCVEVEVTNKLAKAKETFEALMEKVSTLEVEEAQQENLKDLKYLIMDALFFASDLDNFYKHKEIGRFKMRVLNALNKKRRAELFGNEPVGSCPMNLLQKD